MIKPKVIYPDSKEHIGKYYTKPKKLNKPLNEREILVLQLRRDGLTFAKIGLRLGVSHQRATQIYNNIISHKQPL